MDSRIQKIACKDRFSKVVRFFHSDPKTNRIKSISFQLDTNQSNTQLDDLPLELFDTILQKSCLHSLLRIDKPENERDKNVIEKLASINFYCFKRVTQRRFKKAIGFQLSLHYKNTCKRQTIIRNNQRFLLETIQPTDELLQKLQAEKCLIEDHLQSIKKLCRDFDKNWEILQALRPYDEQTSKVFMKCLRHTGQHCVAKIIDKGGVVAKVTAPEAQLIHKLTIKLNEYEDKCKTKENSLQTKKRISSNDIELRPRDHDVVAWIWLKTQRMFMLLQYLIDSNSCKSNFMVETVKELKIFDVSQEINIDDHILQTEFVSCNLLEAILEAEFSVHYLESIDGIAKLQNRIFVISYLPNFSTDQLSNSCSMVGVFEDRSPFRFVKEFEITEIKAPRDLCSSEKDNCLYVADASNANNSIWKITKDEVAIHWVKLDFDRIISLSMTLDAHLFAASSSGRLSVYDFNAKLVHCIKMDDIEELYHAAETLNGNFLILYCWLNKHEETGKKAKGKNDLRWSLSELSRDGKTVVRQFIPQNKIQKLTSLNDGRVCIDSDDQVFLLDNLNARVILLDSKLCWVGILIQMKGEQGDILRPSRRRRRMFFDEINKQLIIGGYQFITVYQLY